MKKALMVSTIIGFIASFEQSDIRILQRMGYEVHIACNCTIYRSAEQVALLEVLGVVKHNIPFARSPLSKTNVEAYRSLNKLMRDERFDIVHCHTPVGGVLGRLAAHKNHVPMVMYSAHGFHFFKGAPFKNQLLFYPIEKYMSRYTDILITINNEDYTVAKEKFHAKKAERIHGVGIDLRKFNMSANFRNAKRKELGVNDGEKVLLSVGELDRDKNHIVVLEAMRMLKQKGYRYFIAGNGALESTYKEYIEENGLTDVVQLLGFRNDVPELLQAADIYVFPSLFEGISVALMEAVAARLPIACTAVRGNVDTVITPDSYFHTNSSSELVNVVEKLSKMDASEKEEMVNRNYENLQLYSLDEVQKEMTRIYTDADSTVQKGASK